MVLGEAPEMNQYRTLFKPGITDRSDFKLRSAIPANKIKKFCEQHDPDSPYCIAFYHKNKLYCLVSQYLPRLTQGNQTQYK